MPKNSIIILAFFAILAGCMQTSNTLSEADKKSYLTLGDSIATYTQLMLLKNLTQAIEDRGTTGAVAFCSEKAIPLSQDASETHHVQISRLTDKNRNPDNKLSSETDKKAWSAISQLMNDKETPQKHWIGKEGDAVYYYKAIPLGMPTCLSCHGKKDGDIAAETLQEISKRYPNDLATGYEMGQLRGVWKVQLK